MSIFKSSFKDYVKTQITARQNLLNSQGSRPIDLQKYVSGKSPWVKMTSFVDYEKSPDLAKKYVLMGGTLYTDPANNKDSNMFEMRSGILGKKASYGTDIGSPKRGTFNLQYGIRPMPGITSVDIKSKSAYGSLREAVVKFYAWDVNQLQDLLILFMRPGYAVLLEWGWSMYIDNSDKKIKSFDTPTINCFDSLLTHDDVYNKLESFRKKLYGNYDGMLGFVRNYETSMLPNGGFECTTTLVSIADVIDSLRVNVSTGTVSNNNNGTSDYKDEFELLLNGFKEEFNENIKTTSDSNESVKKKIIEIKNDADKIPGIDTVIYHIPGYIKEIAGEGAVDSISSYFMQFAYFINILNTQHNLFDKNEKLLDIEIPLSDIPNNSGNGLCVSSINAVSIDNSVCFIKNSKAKSLFSPDGFVPRVKYADTSLHSEDLYDYGPTTGGMLVLHEYLYNDTNLGIIGNVYVNIGKLIDIYKQQQRSNNGFVYVGQYIKQILKEIEFTLGSINNFDIHVLDKKVVIIDKHYVENPIDTKKDTKFQINVLGTNSIVRNQKIISKIFPSQATMIAIAAQSRENVASLQSSTYTYMNKNITNRLFIQGISESPSDVRSDLKKLEDVKTNNTRVLIQYISDHVVNNKTFGSAYPNLTSINTYLNNYLVVVDKATDYKAIVPVSLELVVDGIGGITIGEIFRINNDILPIEYENKNIGFIVMGLSQNITRPDWQTTIQTQFCILDQDELQKEVLLNSSKSNLSVLEAIMAKIKDLTQAISMYNLLAAFFVDLTAGRFQISSNMQGMVYKYRSGVTKKYLKSQIYVEGVSINGVPVTLDGFLTEMGNQTQKAIKTFTNNPDIKIFTDLINSRKSGLNNFEFSKFDQIALMNSIYYKEMERGSPSTGNFDPNNSSVTEDFLRTLTGVLSSIIKYKLNIYEYTFMTSLYSIVNVLNKGNPLVLLQAAIDPEGYNKDFHPDKITIFFKILDPNGSVTQPSGYYKAQFITNAFFMYDVN